MTSIPDNVRNHVRGLRIDLALSQAELGHELGVSRQTINSIEIGRYLPSLPLAMAIARFFDATVEAIFIPDEEEAHL
jgi:putative transcriptional regulator